MSDRSAAARPNVIVGVAGGIAAFKALEVIRLFAESGHNVQVIPTLSALRFVGEASFAALSGNAVHTDIWADVQDVPHIKLGRQADLIVVVPATADFMARAAGGRADDLLTGTLLSASCPILFAPAMHTEMWENAATAANVAQLRQRGIKVLEPAAGRLTGADSGKGRLPDPSQIFQAGQLLLAGNLPDLTAKKVLISAGATREPIDPVRFLSNHSSGKQGYAFAQVAAAAGAQVTLVSANVEIPRPAGVDVVEVGSAAELAGAMKAAASQADIVIMAAAVADFTPSLVANEKIKKSASSVLNLTQTEDVLKWLVENRQPNQLIVGFAAETGDSAKSGIEHAREKLAAKGCDFLVYNSVAGGKVFGADENSVVVLAKSGAEHQIPTASKLEIAITVCHLVIS